VGKIKGPIKKTNKKADQAKDDPKKKLKLPANANITETSKDKASDDGNSFDSISIKSSGDDNSDEEVDRIISLKKIDMKKALPIVGDKSME